MIDKKRKNEIRKPYHKPEIERVRLVPEEAVLGGCKMTGGDAGPGSTCGLGCVDASTVS